MFQRLITFLENIARDRGVTLSARIIGDYGKINELLQDFNRVYKDQDGSIRELEIDQKLIELIQKDSEL